MKYIRCGGIHTMLLS